MAKIFVGLSGGVDSAIAAYLLKKEGHDVSGVFMRNWDSLANQDILGNKNFSIDNICPQELDYLDAQKVAEILGIPLLRVDFVKEYWDEVFTNFLEEYKRGRTPNPDVFCNKYIKFDAFLEYAKKHGADYIATGHYVKKVDSDLYKANDKNKDQSYFLSLLNQKQIDASLFPLGNISKDEVRRIARELDLPIATKKDSTGICFIGERDFKDFLQNYIPAQPGNIVDINTNNVIGKHYGVMYYTFGQRKGLGIGGIRGYETASWFVVDKDVKNSILYVSQGDENKWLLHDKLIVDQVNWLGEKPQDWFKCSAKFRYRQKDNAIKLRFINEYEVEIICDEKVRALTPGQIAVFYDGERLLGGGVIKRID